MTARARTARTPTWIVASGVLASALALPDEARALDTTGTSAPVEATPSVSTTPTSSVEEMEETSPRRTIRAPSSVTRRFLQFGVAFTGEFVTDAGALCAKTTSPCILGSGGGVAARVGFRSESPWYLGLAYELSKQDPNKLYRLAILQQFRFEARYYVATGRRIEPYLAAGAGLAGYGNEWAVDTFGPAAHAGAGMEFQLSRTAVVGLALTYRAIVFRGYTDSSRAVRDAGLAQLVGIDVTLEARDAR
ncbi:MAG: hypothetical protein U0169_18455 [Polyangiaceae bacterium]